MQKISLNITGMHCNGCVKNLTSILQTHNGVKDVTITLSSGLAEIIFNENEINISQLIEAIEDAGFEASE
ncbi:heavy-metal-associated domain-containing protein [Rodentibacter caecimuris]|uniref:HMA domain-containing protein n=1 Tax=Rodentibacter caecimuris TaxID=1796644 RepID=A0ABX3KY27_9PAST|nr:hypothetical protein BKG89_03940 [Rodentibacter heylii]